MKWLNSKVVWAGLIGGALLAVAALAFLPTYLFMPTDAGGPLARMLGGEGPLPASAIAMVSLMAVTLLAVPAGLLGSLVAPPFVPRVAKRG